MAYEFHGEQMNIKSYHTALAFNCGSSQSLHSY